MHVELDEFFVIELPDTMHNVVFRVLAEPFDKAASLKKNDNIIAGPADYISNAWIVGKLLLDGELIR